MAESLGGPESPVYRIRDWSRHFENNRTRDLKTLSWIPIPNKQDGDGYTELLDHPNGAAHFGAWIALVEVASKCDPRGTLVRDGVEAHTPQSLARKSHVPAELWLEALPRLVSIGWVEICAQGAAPSQAGAGIPHEGAPRARARPEGKGREGKGRERKGKDDCAETAKQPAAPAHTIPQELRDLQLYETDAKLCLDFPQIYPTWVQAFPGVDVLAEVRKAHAWEVTHPKNRKTDRARFLNSWLARAQDRAPVGGREPSPADLSAAMRHTLETQP